MKNLALRERKNQKQQGKENFSLEVRGESLEIGLFTFLF